MTDPYCRQCNGRAYHRAMCPTMSGRNFPGDFTTGGADRYLECEACGRSWPSVRLSDLGYCPDCRRRHRAELERLLREEGVPF